MLSLRPLPQLLSRSAFLDPSIKHLAQQASLPVFIRKRTKFERIS